MSVGMWVQLALGVAGTWVGAELLVRGAARLALLLGLRPMVVGLTVVALGTSSPEAIVSILAALRESPGIALGNVVGSNIANIGLILGTSALLRPIPVDASTLRVDVPLMLAATALACLLLLGGEVGRIDGLLLLAALSLYIFYYMRTGRAPADVDDLEAVDTSGVETERAPVDQGDGVGRSILTAVVGLALLMAGAQLLLNGAQAFARAMGIPETVIGVTMVAVGTSLPELVASIVALLRGHQEIAVGNVLGSNVFNLLFVLGLTATVHPIPVDSQTLGSFVPVMVAFSVILVPLLRRYRLTRWEGGILLGGYLLFSVLAY